MRTGRLEPATWTRVVDGWGKYTVGYGVHVELGVAGEYRCYSAPFPWPTSSGRLPATVDLTVLGYGAVWLWAAAPTSYQLVPVGP